MGRIGLFVVCTLGFSFVTGCGVSQPDPIAGRDLAASKGCLACHAADASTKIGPSWAGLYGSQVELNDGTTIVADDAYLEESIFDPNAKIVEGYTPYAMPAIPLSTPELRSIVEYLKTMD